MVETTEYRPTIHGRIVRKVVPVSLRRHWQPNGWVGKTRPEAGVRPATIVMLDPFLENHPKVRFVHWNQVIETFPAKRSYHSLAERICERRPEGVFKTVSGMASMASSSAGEKIESRSWMSHR